MYGWTEYQYFEQICTKYQKPNTIRLSGMEQYKYE